MTRRAVLVCVDCGGDKSRFHRMTQRCAPCGKVFYAAMRVANQITNDARRRGLIAPARGQLCVDCGAPATELDHRDYSKPLEVEAVCRPCNFKRGPAKFARASVNDIYAAPAATEQPA